MRNWLFGLLILCFGAGFASAQFIEYNHPELEWYSFETENFVIHFHKGTQRTALVVAKIAEEIHPHITRTYNYYPKDKIHFIIKDIDDYSNGGAFFFDNKVEIWAKNLDYVMRGTKNWLRDVVTHEYTHMISIQNMVKSNLTFPYGFFQLFGYEEERRKDVVRGFPNTLVSYPISSINIPIWFAEGVAQHQVDSSRYDYRDPHREMILRDRVLHDRLLTFNEMGVFGKNSHGNESSYNLGFSFVDYLTNRFGEGILADITKQSSKWSSYTFDGVLHDVIGIAVDSLYLDWKDSLKTVYSSRTAIIRSNQVKGKPVANDGFANLYPVWSPDGKKIAYVTNQGKDYFGLNRLVVYDTSTKKIKDLVSAISSSLSWSADGRYIAYSRDERNDNASAYNDLFLYDLQNDEEIRLTKNLRGTNPDFNHDGTKLAFVTGTNGLHQLNIYHFPDQFSDDFEKKIYYDVETGQMIDNESADPAEFREVTYKGGKIEQVLTFENGRQIYHPRWSNDDSRIIFDTATDYGRDLGIYDFNSGQFSIFMAAKEELRYPYFQPDSPYLYYSASSTGIYNIYRYNLSSKEKELVTNVTGGAFMPAINKEGQLAYAFYDSVGYNIYKIEKPAVIDPAMAEYDSRYLNSIPQKNFDNTIDFTPEIKEYKQTFTNVHVLPRLLIDYGTVKPGLYVISNDVLNKYSLIGGGTINSHFDYDLYGYFEVREFEPTLFVEAINMNANIEDSLHVYPGAYMLVFNRDVNFNLSEVRLGFTERLVESPIDFTKAFDLTGSFVWRKYSAKIKQPLVWDPVKQDYSPESGWTIRYNYLKGWALELGLTGNMVSSDKNKMINPSGGRYIFLKYSYESNDFIEDFASSPTGIKEVYKKYNYHQIILDWEEFFKNPLLKNHAFSVRLRSGYIDRPVDSFFNLFAGGLLGMKGYSYFSIEGRQKLIGTLTYRFPLFNHIDAKLGHLYFDKLYMGLFYDYGNAWNGDPDFSNFKQDIGLQLRLNVFSYSLFPTRFFAEAVYPLNKAVNENVQYNQDWRFYFGVLFDFDIRERISGIMRQLPL